MPISNKLIDQLLEGNSSPEDILGDDGLLKQLTKLPGAEEFATTENQHVPDLCKEADFADFASGDARQNVNADGAATTCSCKGST